MYRLSICAAAPTPFHPTPSGIMATLRKSELQYLCKVLEIEVSGDRVADYVAALRGAIQKGMENKPPTAAPITMDRSVARV